MLNFPTVLEPQPLLEAPIAAAPMWFPTPNQQKFLELLETDVVSRTISIVLLCRRAGFNTITAWYTALKDPIFKARVEALGLIVQRQAPSIKGVVALSADPDREWEHDLVDLRRLLPNYPKHLSRAAFGLNFGFIDNPQLRLLLKRYMRGRLGFWEAASFRCYLANMKPFLLGLSQKYPALQSFSELTRTMAEPLLTSLQWTDQAGQIHPISPHRRNLMLITLQVMFDYMRRHNWPQAPTQTLIYAEDHPIVPKPQPRPLPPLILEQLMANLHLLKNYDRHLVAILSVTGLRTEDALHLSEDCLQYDSSGDPRLHWYNHKMKREGRLLPITEAVVQAIVKQCALVKLLPDHHGGKYIFRTESGLYQFQTFSRHLHKLARQVPILDLNGQVYNFQPHQFRHTVGTQMINNGLGIADVMAYLDHRSPEMTLRYAQIEDETLKAKFKQMVLAGQVTGGLALTGLRTQLAEGNEAELDWVVANLRRLSLPWGHCLHHAKATKCPYGQNVCFTKDNGPCHKLVTTPAHAPVIVATLADLKQSQRVASEKGWELYAQDLSAQINGMEQVLAKLEVMDTFNPAELGLATTPGPLELEAGVPSQEAYPRLPQIRRDVAQPSLPKADPHSSQKGGSK